MTHRTPDRSDCPAPPAGDGPGGWQAYLDVLGADIGRLGERISKFERRLDRRLRWWPVYVVARVVALVGALYLLAALVLYLSGSR